MPITITNTLATITNGTNIYLQQQITTTHNTMPVDSWIIFGASVSVGDVATIVSAIFMAITAWIMWYSVLEIRKQNTNFSSIY